MKQVFKPILLVAAMAAGFAHAGEMTMVNFGGANSLAQKAAYVEPFQKATGNKVTVVEYNGEMAKIKAMVETKKVSWDLVELESGEIGRACDEGLLEKIDINKLGKKEDFMPAAIHECGLGAFVWSTVLGYNADKLKTAPTSWADFWDVKKFPGKRGLRKGARFNMEFALMADGVAPKDVYNVLSTKAGVDRAFKKFDDLKGNIQWWEAGAQPPQFLVAGDVVMSSVYNGRIDAAQREGKNLAISWNGSIYDLDYWVIPKGAKNKDVAEQFIAATSTAEAQHNYATKIAYGPVNNNAFKRMDAKLLSQLPTSVANAKTAVQANLKFWADHGEELEQRFAAWAAK
jgi:putative spermidine/putrescine transport system substrate-binding protein